MLGLYLLTIPSVLALICFAAGEITEVIAHHQGVSATAAGDMH